MEHRIFTQLNDNSTWFRYWFDSCFYHNLYANRNEKEAADFVDELLCELQPPVHARVLDLGCGNGRHSKYLASKGFDVTGIDLAASSIQHAKRWETSTLKFHRQDMRSPFGKNTFDYVFNFFTSFGYFSDPSDDHKVARNMARALKPDGILVMDYINSTSAEKKLKSYEEKEIDGIVYRITRWTNEKHFFKKIVVSEMSAGKPQEYVERVRKFSPDELSGLFNVNGLEVTNVFGDYRLNAYNKETSPRIILVAKKMS